VTIGRDQALAKSFTKLFERTGWTQGKLAEREGSAWVTFRLRFERFLRFTGTVSLPADLTERRFRALWAQTDKNTREEELRFRQVVKLLCPRGVAADRGRRSSTRHARRRSARRPVARARDVPRHRSARRREPDVAEAPMATSPIQRKNSQGWAAQRSRDSRGRR
jgi:hypothetical protein